jgi:hypothetical protein
MMLLMKVLGPRLSLKWLMSSTSNVVSCLLNCHKKLRPTLMQMSPHSLLVMKQSVYAVEPVCRSVGDGDGVADTGFISGVDPQPIGTGFALDIFLTKIGGEIPYCTFIKINKDIFTYYRTRLTCHLID